MNNEVNLSIAARSYLKNRGLKNPLKTFLFNARYIYFTRFCVVLFSLILIFMMNNESLTIIGYLALGWYISSMVRDLEWYRFLAKNYDHQQKLLNWELIEQLAKKIPEKP